MSHPVKSFQIGDKDWEKMRTRGLSDLYYFASAILGLKDKIPMTEPTHLLLCRFIEGKTGNPLLDEAPYKKIEMPRETGKSTLLRARVIQRICENPNVAMLLVNEKELLVRDFLSSIKFEFENNNLLRALYPTIVPADLNATTWSGTRIIVNRSTGRPDPTIDVAGVGAALAGKHPDEIYCDDIISREAMENARAGARQIMDGVNRWIHQLEPIVNKSAKPRPLILFCGTRWWYGDSYEHIEEAFSYGQEEQRVILRAELSDGSVQQLTAYRKGNVAVFRRSAIEDGRSIFPEKWSLEKLAEIRMTDPVLFAANYMNKPADEVTAVFKPDWLKHFIWLDSNQFYFTNAAAQKQVRQFRDLDKIIIVDPGGFQAGVGDDRARAAAAVLGDDLKGSYFFLDCYSERDTYINAIRQIVAFAIKYTPRRIYVERAGAQVAFAELLRRELKAAGCDVVVDDTTLKPGNAAGSANKELRILEMEPYFQRGQVYVGTGPQFHEFQNQYSTFPRSPRVDVIDLLGYWPRLMRKQGNGAVSQQQRQQAELSAYRARLATLRR